MPEIHTPGEKEKNSPRIDSFFRSEAWVQAWIDVYGKDSRITLIDPYGRNNPLDFLYSIKAPVRKWLSFRTLALAGTAISPLSAPRSEYNYPGELSDSAARNTELLSAVGGVPWSQIIFKDMAHWAVPGIERQAEQHGWSLHRNLSEPTYYISAEDIDIYKATLTASVRARYFNRRSRLKSYGTLEFFDYTVSEANQFFDLLDEFHSRRWGQPCYSSLSRVFLQNFMERLVSGGGNVLMQAMRVNGKAISLLYDLVYKNRRYNLQSGFDEHFMPGISPGALHMGYGIEAAIKAGQQYDLLAGHGKYHNYKAAIANRQSGIQTVIIQKLQVDILRKAKQFSSSLFSQDQR